MTTVYELLTTAPNEAVPAVQDALRAVVQGDWKLAAKKLDSACDACSEENEWFKAAGELADKFHKRYFA